MLDKKMFCHYIWVYRPQGVSTEKILFSHWRPQEGTGANFEVRFSENILWAFMFKMLISDESKCNLLLSNS